MTYKEAFKMKKMTKTFGTIALSLGLLSTTIATGTVNAATYDTASIKDFRTVHTQTSVYSKPSQTAKKVGSLRSTEAVVINKNVANGWTKIRFGFETGYVKTSALKKAAANTSTSYAKNISKKYTYTTPQNKGSEFTTQYVAQFKKAMAYNDSSVNFWFYNSEPDAQGVTEYDTAKGLYVGNVDTGKLELAVPYPAKKGTSFKGFDHKKSVVFSTTATVKLHGKTYKNVVIIKNGGQQYYYAPNKGLIQLRENGKALVKLVK